MQGRLMSVRETFLPRRMLGRTGFQVTALGIGDVADRSVPLEQCVATVRRALDAGLNLIDTAPGYEEGYSEQIVGTALRESGLRDRLFVIDKIDELEAPVGPQIDASLGRLGIDHTDLFVLHGLSTMAHWQAAAGPGGSMEQLASAIRAGKTRFRGISSHHPDVLAAAIPSGLVDVAMFPVGPFVDERYVMEILPLARKHGVGSVCFKTFGAGKLLGDTEGYQRPLSSRPRGKISSGGRDGAASTLPYLGVEECMHYTLTLDPDVALLGMSFANEQDAAFAAARSFKRPLSEVQMADIQRRAQVAIRDKGPCWWNPPVSA
jgi:aryl-alcohol dehydrogenase-like predicted oxidoreductase